MIIQMMNMITEMTIVMNVVDMEMITLLTMKES